ncbi:uncharacterized protein LOC116418420 [Piliocolobus tephrosceles]|uniref:uncharacterized protein LOC116418420 n=1 Tax=Piliocolobus tephrosceles TaxID=591936 RepID=UPI001300EE2A|nr:uncharacterized protein LOC116418420 [Piliocolobus tephrosceles]
MVTISRTQNAGIFWPKQGLGPPNVRWVPLGSLPPAQFSFPKRVPATLPRSAAHGHPAELGPAGICFQLSGYYEPSTGGSNGSKIQSLPRRSSRHVRKRTGNGETTDEDRKRRDHGRGPETERPRERTGNGETTGEDRKRRDHGRGPEMERPQTRTGNGETMRYGHVRYPWWVLCIVLSAWVHGGLRIRIHLCSSEDPFPRRPHGPAARLCQGVQAHLKGHWPPCNVHGQGPCYPALIPKTRSQQETLSTPPPFSSSYFSIGKKPQEADSMS